MLKNIKKSLKYFIIFGGIVIMLPTVLYLCIQIPAVQTLLLKRITNHFSEELKSTISFGKMEYRFFNRLSVSDTVNKRQK